ncbi:retrovirus-related Pol polyprotein from transposon TNT 1-94 [Trichonephila clavipes]|nr:retrovirus-related Pol polyprotein from transposon TNT 1-94 [Trichonephila clavipes]
MYLRQSNRLSFGTREKASEPGELISADVCGPFDESFQKKKYLVVFKDSFTKFHYGYLIKEKSEVKKVLEHMLAHTGTLGYSVKEFLCDNGGEFDNKDVHEILHSNGITQRLTAPYTPEQNGASEREMRTTIEMARTLKYSNPEVSFPAAIWAELVNSAIYILNRTGKSSIENTSPYELWLKKKPRLKHLRIIGSQCYAHVPAQKRRKMDKKAIQGYLVGYDGDERYRIWLKKEHRVILSRDVIFQEKAGKCDDRTELKLEDRIRGDTNQGKYEKQLIKIEDNPIEKTLSQEDLSDSETDREEDAEPTSDRQLRNRSLLQKPKRFEDHIMEAESYLDDYNPETYEEAINSKDSTNWKKAMESEINSLSENHTWELSDLPVGAKAIPCKWVYRLKTNPDGSINKYKARLVARGFSQRKGIDYSETYSPVAKLGTIRTVLSIAAEERMHLTQFDVSTAFLYGDLEETIFMKQPEGFKDGSGRVCKLKRSLYGLKQSPRCWNKCFGQFLTDLGFKASEADPCLYIRERKGRKLLIVLYVDDGLIAATDQQDSEMFSKELKTKFKISVGKVSSFLGLEIEHHKDNSITINQKGYARKYLNVLDLRNANLWQRLC